MSLPVKVNVGGVIFTTNLATLQGAKYFSELALDPDLSNVLIDRDSVAFGYLLNCLRDHRYITSEKLSEYSNEIDYFGMDVLTRRLEETLPTVRVLPNSKFSVEFWQGILKVKSTQVIQLVSGQEVPFDIECVLPYDGYVEVSFSSSLQDSRVLGQAGKVCLPTGRPKATRTFPVNTNLCELQFHRNIPTCRILP